MQSKLAQKSSSAQMMGGLCVLAVAAYLGYTNFETDGIIFLASCFVGGLGGILILFKNEPKRKFREEWKREIAQFNQDMQSFRNQQILAQRQHLEQQQNLQRQEMQRQQVQHQSGEQQQPYSGQAAVKLNIFDE